MVNNQRKAVQVVFLSLAVVGIGAWIGLAASVQQADDVPPSTVLRVFPSIQRAINAEQVAEAAFADAGLEPGVSGFHSVWPTHLPSGASLRLAKSNSVNTSLAGDVFVQVPLLDPSAYAQPVASLLEGSNDGPFGWTVWERVGVGLDRAAVTQIADGFRTQTANGWSITLTFDNRGLDVLEALVGAPDPVERYFDWFGVSRAAGESPTGLRLALVVDGVALTPFLVTDVLAAGTTANVVVATGLSQADSAAILATCGF